MHGFDSLVGGGILLLLLELLMIAVVSNANMYGSGRMQLVMLNLNHVKIALHDFDCPKQNKLSTFDLVERQFLMQNKHDRIRTLTESVMLCPAYQTSWIIENLHDKPSTLPDPDIYAFDRSSPTTTRPEKLLPPTSRPMPSSPIRWERKTKGRHFSSGRTSTGSFMEQLQTVWEERALASTMPVNASNSRRTGTWAERRRRRSRCGIAKN
ncbi:unnamed protein product [Amoebophrya sp. A120]|nr:unnamed protein product [Amoebophrya sp. A120]|eukprot:GSA120T00008508001.1